MILLEVILFISFLITCAFVPGKFICYKLKLRLESHEELFFATGFGLLIFVLISYILSWIHLAIFAVPILLIVDFLAVRKKQFLPQKIEKEHVKPLILVTILAIIFSSYMLILGIHGNTITFRNDDLWHLALENEMRVNFPPQNPSLALSPLRGYHFFYDFLNAKIASDFIISPFTLHFFLVPILNAFLWTFGVYSLMYKWSKRVSASLWAVFLTISGGSFAFVLLLTGHPGFNLISSLGIDQPFDSLFNPPFAVSVIMLIAIFFATHEYLQTKNYNWLVPISLFVGLISIFKVYGGLIAIPVFGILFLHELLKKRFKIILAGTAAGILFLVTYWYFVGGTGSLILYPLWAPYRVMQTFPWYNFDNKMYVYTREYVIKGIIQTNAETLLVFVVGNLGTRFIGLLLLPIIFLKTKKFPSFFAILIAVAMLVSFLIPLFFIQTGQVFETIQIDWYFLFFASLAAALGFGAFFDLKFNKILKAILILIIVVATLPSTYEQLTRYPATIASAQSLSSPDFSAMKYLATQGDYNQTVLEIPDKSTTPTDEGIKFWFKGTTPAIPAFGNKRSFYNFELNTFPVKDIDKRISFVSDLLTLAENVDRANDFSLKKKISEQIKQNNIKFILSPYEVEGFKNMSGVKKVYQNKTYTIYKVD